MTDLSTRTRVRTALLRLAPEAGQAGHLDPRRPPEMPSGPEILIVRPDHVGDVLFTGPAVRCVRAAWPDAAITMLVGPWAAQLASRLPGVDAVRTLTFPWYDRRGRGAPWRSYGQLRREAQGLRTEGGDPFDVAVILRDDDYWGAWLAARAKVPLRVGHSDPGVGRFVSHALPDQGRPTHTAAANIALVGALAGLPPSNPSPEAHTLELRLLPADEERASSLLEPLAGTERDRGQRPIAVHPGSGAAVKRWRAAAWAHSLAQLTAPEETVIVTGGEAERELSSELAAHVERPVLDLTGRTDLGTLAAVYARCRLVMGPDSGPLHVATAVGTPTVHLFGPADAARFGPWGPDSRHRVVEAGLPCAPCGRLDWPDTSDHPCVRVIEARAVIDAARSCCAQTCDL